MNEEVGRRVLGCKGLAWKPELRFARRCEAGREKRCGVMEETLQ